MFSKSLRFIHKMCSLVRVPHPLSCCAVQILAWGIHTHKKLLLHLVAEFCSKTRNTSLGRFYWEYTYLGNKISNRNTPVTKRQRKFNLGDTRWRQWSTLSLKIYNFFKSVATIIRLDFFMPVDQSSLTPVDCMMSWGKQVLVVGLSCALWDVSQDLGLYPLDAGSNYPPPLCDNQNCLPRLPTGPRA